MNSKRRPYFDKALSSDQYDSFLEDTGQEDIFFATIDPSQEVFYDCEMSLDSDDDTVVTSQVSPPTYGGTDVESDTSSFTPRLIETSEEELDDTSEVSDTSVHF